MSVCVSLFPWRYSEYHSLLIFQALHTQLTRLGAVASLSFSISFAQAGS